MSASGLQTPPAGLVILAGLPGSGKTTLARGLALRLGGVLLRIDTIEQAIRASSLGAGDLEDSGYRVAFALAEDNLRLGRLVIANSVNPIPLTRRAWRQVARRRHLPALEVEVLCSDAAEHRRRVEARLAAAAEPGLPDWPAVAGRDYRPWPRPPLRLDTAGLSPEAALDRLLGRLPEWLAPAPG